MLKSKSSKRSPNSRTRTRTRTKIPLREEFTSADVKEFEKMLENNYYKTHLTPAELELQKLKQLEEEALQKIKEEKNNDIMTVLSRMKVSHKPESTNQRSIFSRILGTRRRGGSKKRKSKSKTRKNKNKK